MCGDSCPADCETDVKWGPPTHPLAARLGLVEVFSTRSFLYFSFAFVKPASGRGSEHLSLKAHGEL